MLERRSPLGIPYALLILLGFFFVLPAAFRAARLSLKQKENDVKDWLPSDFRETAELNWFADHFAGESFVLATWPGCTAGDSRLTLLQRKLHHESEAYDPADDFSPSMVKSIERARQTGRELGLLMSGRDHANWGGKNEKWFLGSGGQWYYLLPNGQLFRWEETQSGPTALIRSIKKSRGTYELVGQPITAFGDQQNPNGVNPFYNDPSLFTVPLFHSVQTGETIVDELASPGGPLWPIDATEPEMRERVARRRAMERLTGTLFAPAVARDFAWTGQAIADSITTERVVTDNLIALAQAEIDSIVDDRFDGDLANLKTALSPVQTEVWYQIFDAIKVDPPPRLTCVLVTLSDAAKENLVMALGRGVLDLPRGRLHTLAEASGLTPASPPSMAPPPFNVEKPDQIGDAPPLRLGGPPVDNVAIDEEGTVTLVRLVGYSLLLGLVLSYVCFRSFKITLMVFVVGGTSAVLSMAMVRWTGGRVDAILMSMPSLVYVLGLSGAIHVVNYYRDEVRVRGESGAAGRALRHALIPCSLASATTAIGLISLFTSNLAPISNFGLYAAVGVISTLAVLFSYLPAALQTFKTKVPMETPVEGRRSEGALSNWWAAVGRSIAKHHAVVTIGCLTVLAVAAFGLPKLQTSVQLLKLFDSGSRIIRDYAWLEDHFGKLVPMEVVVRMPVEVQAESPAAKDNPLSLDILERTEAIARVRRVIYQTLGEPGSGVVGQASAADTFLPPLPAPSNGYSPVRAKFKRELEDAAEQLRDNDYLRIEKDGPLAGSELWRISLRVAALSDVDYGQFIHTVQAAVDPVMRAYAVREQVVAAIGEKEGGKAGRVLVLGADEPSTIEDAELIDGSGEIASETTLLLTLRELLQNEPIETPSWRAIDPAKAKMLVKKAAWSKYLASFDVVIWTGDDACTRGDLASANHVIDLRETLAAQWVPVLLPGQIPDVENGGPLTAIFTGVVPVIYKAQRTLLVSLTESIGMAFVLIAGVMFVLLNPGRSVRSLLRPANLLSGMAAGSVAMIPNVFPVLLVFGIMCHLSIKIDIGTMMVASVAMGVAVDDTIHFLSWFRENLDRGMGRIDAVIETYRRVGPAMTQTTIVGGLGLFVFALSTFTPTQRFGTLMLVMLSAALVGDLVLLPALLAGPLGRFFKARDVSQVDGDDFVPEFSDPMMGREERADAETDGAEVESERDGGHSPPRLRIHFPVDDDSSSPRTRAK